MEPIRRRLLVSLVLACILSGACGSAGSGAGGGAGAAPGTPSTTIPPDAPVSAAPGPASPGRPRPERVTPRRGMADLRPVEWERARRLGPRTLDIFFWSGVEPCYVLDHVEVIYRPDRVVVTLFEGHDPSAGDVACIEIAKQKVVRVELDEPLRGRRVVPGR